MLPSDLKFTFGLGIKQAGGWTGEPAHMDQQPMLPAVSNLLARGIQDFVLILFINA
jgi:hypothetical protein